MFATLTALAMLAALAAADDTDNSQLQFVNILQKGVLGKQLGEWLGPFYIPDGQCSGVLDDLLSCPSGQTPVSVRVKVQDTSLFPLVALHDSLLRASVLRVQPCRGEATVTVQLACAETSHSLAASRLF